jgi:hypothetical protein
MEGIHRPFRAWAFAAVGAVAVAGSQAATTWRVCESSCTLKTIQSAVDVAASGDEIIVYPGRYVENVTISGKELSIVGNNGNDAISPVLIVGTGRGPVFTLGAATGGPYYQVNLSLLTISGGSHENGSGIGGGIQVRQGAFLHLSDVTVASNGATSGGGIGVNTLGGPTTTLTNCNILSNTASTGGGLYVAAGSKVTLEHCSVENNSAIGSVNDASLAARGGGVYSDTGSQITIDQTVISSNHVTGPCHVSGGTRVFCADADGGGLYLSGEMAITASNVTGNDATDPTGHALGAGLYATLGATQSIQNTVLIHNSTSSGDGMATGGGIYAASSNPGSKLTLTNVYVLENSAEDFVAPEEAGGIDNHGTLVVSNSIFKDNHGFDCRGGSGCP